VYNSLDELIELRDRIRISIERMEQIDAGGRALVARELDERRNLLQRLEADIRRLTDKSAEN
jgi:hypothetical protein